MPPTLSHLETLARQAGDILRAGFIHRPGFDLQHQVEYKGVIDLVTEVDLRSEAFLVGEIRRVFPGHRILAEEGGELTGQDCCLWYIDPLDGTVNFAHGVPVFTVSLAYAEGGLLRLGAVYDPMRDECFSAERGMGAWLNGQPIRVSEMRQLAQSLLVTGFPYDIRSNPENNLAHFNRLMLLTLGVRRLGSAALDLAYVAAGRFDGYWELGVHSWDIAAGALIAQEAGALVTRMDGESFILSPPYTILAANPHLHPQIMQVLNQDS